MSEVSCYHMRLICDDPDSHHAGEEFKHEFAGHNRRDCVNQAQEDGWTFHQHGIRLCPDCSAREARKPFYARIGNRSA